MPTTNTKHPQHRRQGAGSLPKTLKSISLYVCPDPSPDAFPFMCVLVNLQKTKRKETKRTTTASQTYQFAQLTPAEAPISSLVLRLVSSIRPSVDRVPPDSFRERFPIPSSVFRSHTSHRLPLPTTACQNNRPTKKNWDPPGPSDQSTAWCRIQGLSSPEQQ